MAYPSRGLRHLCNSASRISLRSSRALSSSSSSSPPLHDQSIQETNKQQQTNSPVSHEEILDPKPIPSDSALSSDDFIPLEDDSSPKQRGFWTAAKALLAGSLVAGTLASAYVSYAYTFDEVSKKVSDMRKTSVESSRVEDDSLLQRIQSVLYSTSMKAAVGVAELYLEARRSIEDQVKGFAAPASDKLLPDLLPQERHVFTLVLDLNETLVYSDWTRDRGWRTFKRPGAEAFLEHLAQYYELVVYTDQLPFTVDPILEKLDQKGCIRYRLAREATQYVNGKHYKDLSKLNRDPTRVMFISAHAKETCLQPENAVVVKPWKLESDDTTLLDLLPFFEYVARYRPADIRPVLASYDGHDIPSEFLARTKDYQRKMREVKSQNPFFRSSRN